MTNQELLKEKLKENKMTSITLGEKLGVHYSVVSKLIHGHQKFTDNYINKLNTIFNTDEFKLNSKYNIGDKVIAESYSYLITDIKQTVDGKIVYKLNNNKQKLYSEDVLKSFNPPYNKGDKVKLHNNITITIHSCTGYSKGDYNYCFYTDDGQYKFFKGKDIVEEVHPLQAPKIEFKEENDDYLDSLTYFEEKLDLGNPEEPEFSEVPEPDKPMKYNPAYNPFDLLLSKIDLNNLSPEEAKILALAKAKEMLK